MIAAATEELLGILKYVLLGLLYVFFARVLWAVWSEVRGPRPGVAAPQAARAGLAPSDPTVPAPAPLAPAGKLSKRAVRAPKGRRGDVGRLVVTEPKARRGAAFAIADEITLGRAATCTVGMPDDSFVSQLHARVFRQAGTTIIEDLGSTNGTYLNGKRLTTPAPDGSYLAGPLYDEEGILYAELDPDLLLRARQRFDPAGHYHRPDVLQLTVRDQSPS